MKRPLALVGFSYLLALTVALFFGEQNCLYLVCLTSVLFTIFTFVATLRKGKSIAAAMLAATIAIGLFWWESSSISNVENLDGKQVEISGVVVELPYDQNYRYCYTVEVRKAGNFDFPKGGRVLIYAREPIANEPGDWIEGEMTLLLPEDDGIFCQRSTLAAERIYLYAFPVDEGAVSTPGRESSLWISLLKCRIRLDDAVDSVLSQRDAGLVKAILFGEKNALSETVEEQFRTAGVSHLLAVSGFHMAIMVRLFTMLFRALRFPRRLSAAGVAVGIVLFMALTGFSPSVSRSGIMCLILLAGELFGRRADTLNSLGLAVLLLCFLNPYAAADIGFLLSVSATAGLALLEGRLQAALSAFQPAGDLFCRILRPVNALLASSLSAMLFTLPLVLPLFGTISPAALPANLLMVFPCSVLLQLSAVMVLLAVVAPPAAALAAIPVSWLCRYLTGCAEVLSELPFASFSFSGRTAYLWLACALLLFGIAVLIGRGKPRFRTAGLLSVILFLLSLLCQTLSVRDVTCCSILSSGDGISIVITRNGRAAVVGCAGYSETPVLQALDDRNMTSLDLLVMVGESFEEGSNAGHIAEKKTTQTLICRSDSLANATVLAASEKAGETLVYGNGYSVSLWDGAVAVERNGDFVRILCGKEKILLWPDGAEAETLPEDWKDCTILLMEELPDTFRELDPVYGIFCMDEDSVSHVWRADYTFLPLASQDGTVELRIGEGKETQVRREF